MQEQASAERQRETRQAKRMVIAKGVSQLLYVCSSPLLMMGMLLGAQLAEGSAVPVARFYTSFSVCVYLVEMSMYCIPRGIQGFVEVGIALGRVCRFLTLEETGPGSQRLIAAAGPAARQ